MGITNFKKYDTFPAYADIQTINSSTTPTITLSKSFANDLILANTSSSSILITLPQDSTATIPVGRTFTIIQTGTNQVFILPETNVSIYVEPLSAAITSTTTPNRISTRRQYSKLTFTKIDANTWVTEGYGNYIQSTEPSYPVTGDLWIF
jgi:hypothetical protein